MCKLVTRAALGLIAGCAIGMGSQALAQELLKRRRARSRAHFRAGFDR